MRRRVSTNYYVRWRGDIVDDPIELHVGRTGNGAVSLQAYVRPFVHPLDDDWPEVHSWSDWLELFKWRPGYTLTTEYGQELTLEELRERLFDSTHMERSSTYRWVQENRANGYAYIDESDHWLDEEGFTMSRREFF